MLVVQQPPRLCPQVMNGVLLAPQERITVIETQADNDN